jgi:hypothetical protein
MKTYPSLDSSKKSRREKLHIVQAILFAVLFVSNFVTASKAALFFCAFKIGSEIFIVYTFYHAKLNRVTGFISVPLCIFFRSVIHKGLPKTVPLEDYGET